MMKTMLGLLCACAVVARATEHNAMSVNHNARSKLLLAFMRDLLFMVLRNLFPPPFTRRGGAGPSPYPLAGGERNHLAVRAGAVWGASSYADMFVEDCCAGVTERLRAFPINLPAG